MDAVELIALASSVSLLAGWRLYLVTFVTGLAMKLGWIDLPERLAVLDVLQRLLGRDAVRGELAQGIGGGDQGRCMRLEHPEEVPFAGQQALKPSEHERPL